MSLALLTAPLLTPTARAQWAVTDSNGKPLTPSNSVYPLVGQETAAVTPNYNIPYTTDAQGNRSYYYSPPDNGASLNTPAGQTTGSIGVGVGASNGVYGYGPNPTNINGSVQGNAGGTLWAFFTWQGAAPPPDHLDVLLLTSASANASGSCTQPSGLSTKATASISQFGETATATFPAGTAPSSVQGRHLLRLPVQGRVAKVSLSGTVVASASNGVPYFVSTGYGPLYYPASDGSGGYISGNVAFDNREVYITCPDIENANAKGPVPDVRDPSTGAITVDSAVTWGVSVNNVFGWGASHQYYAITSNFVNPFYQWSIAGDGTMSSFSPQSLGEQYFDSHYYFAEDFGQIFGNSLNKSSTVTVTVQDSTLPSNAGIPAGDGGVAANTFTIRWHYPYENWQTSGAAFQNAPAAYHSTNGPQGANGQVAIPVSAAKTDWSVAGKIGSGIIATGAALAAGTDPIVLGFAAATGAALGSINPPPAPTTYYISAPYSQFQQDVNTELSIASGNTSGVFLPGVARMTPTFARLVSSSGNPNSYYGGSAHGTLNFDATAYRIQWQQNYVGDAYGVKGYTGPASAYVQWEGQWTYVYNWTWVPAGQP